MRRFLILIFVLCMAISSKADYYIAYATTSVNLRECPSTDCDILAKVPKNEILFIDAADKINGFYRVVFVDQDIHGYVAAQYVKLYQKVKEENGNILSPSAKSQDFNPVVDITNDADVPMTLTVNDASYHFEANEEKNITLSPGKVKIMASSPGIIPFVGNDNVLSNYIYTWRFYIIKTRR